MPRKLFCILAAALFAVPALAKDYTAGPLKIGQPWARATPKGASVGGGYLTITNTGSEPDRLVGGSSPVAKEFELHQMSMDRGIMKMRPVDGGLEIAPGKTVTFSPSGYHIMFVGLQQQMKQGEKVPATLEFAKAGKVQVEFTVESLGATQASQAGHLGHDMKSMPGMGH